jgi:hypothetical protein
MTDAEQRIYLEQVRAVLRPGGNLHLLCFSEQQPGDSGPRRIKRSELETLLASGWRDLTVVETRFAVNTSEAGAAAYLASAQRVA